ncbi:MAG: phenylacetate--CoA ligase [Christensenellaceae bacterium]|jgi:phenylacetate-CoA ligase|nr:phenylacetate--CoA ligase [Christensenellaceae bacterium]
MFWNKPIETMKREELERLQLERLRATVRRVYQNVPLYRMRMQEKGLVPEDIKTLQDVQKLPFTQKTDLRDEYPYGLFAAPREEIVRVHASSGTTGKPVVAGYTQADLQIWAEVVARCLGCADVDYRDTVQVAYGYGLFTGGLGLHDGAQRVGAQVVPISSGNTQRQLMLMEDLGSTVLACTPSYALMIGESLRDSGFDLTRLKLRKGVFGAEPWTEGMRDQIEGLLGIQALDIYGLTETMGPGVAMECLEGRNGLHVWEDHFLIEILDPESGAPLPDGETGELVISTISKEGMPLLRYRTHDLTSILPEPCACGRTHRRIRRLRGRTDDMLIIRGVNVFPSQVEAAIMGIEGIAPRYLLVVDRVNNLDTLEVQVELMPNLPFDEVRQIERLEGQVRRAVEQVLNLSVRLRLVEPGSIERSEGKSRRVLDKRTLFN